MSEDTLEDLYVEHARMEDRLRSLESAEIEGRTVEGYIDELRAVRNRVVELKNEITETEAHLDLLWESSSDPLLDT
jgi:hypothetical protein